MSRAKLATCCPVRGLTAATNRTATGERRRRQARDNAPLTVLTLDRAVSIRDYRVSRLRRYRQGPCPLDSGLARRLFLTVARSGRRCPRPAYQHSHLQVARLWRPADAPSPRELSRCPLPPESRSRSRRTRIQDRLPAIEANRAAFGFDARNFGQGVSVDGWPPSRARAAWRPWCVGSAARAEPGRAAPLRRLPSRHSAAAFGSRATLDKHLSL